MPNKLLQDSLNRLRTNDIESQDVNNYIDNRPTESNSQIQNAKELFSPLLGVTTGALEDASTIGKMLTQGMPKINSPYIDNYSNSEPTPLDNSVQSIKTFANPNAGFSGGVDMARYIPDMVPIATAENLASHVIESGSGLLEKYLPKVLEKAANISKNIIEKGGMPLNIASHAVKSGIINTESQFLHGELNNDNGGGVYDISPDKTAEAFATGSLMAGIDVPINLLSKVPRTIAKSRKMKIINKDNGLFKISKTLSDEIQNKVKLTNSKKINNDITMNTYTSSDGKTMTVFKDKNNNSFMSNEEDTSRALLDKFIDKKYKNQDHISTLTTKESDMFSNALDEAKSKQSKKEPQDGKKEKDYFSDEVEDTPIDDINNLDSLSKDEEYQIKLDKFKNNNLNDKAISIEKSKLEKEYNDGKAYINMSKDEAMKQINKDAIEQAYENSSMRSEPTDIPEKTQVKASNFKDRVSRVISQFRKNITESLSKTETDVHSEDMVNGFFNNVEKNTYKSILDKKDAKLYTQIKLSMKNLHKKIIDKVKKVTGSTDLDNASIMKYIQSKTDKIENILTKIGDSSDIPEGKTYTSIIKEEIQKLNDEISNDNLIIDNNGKLKLEPEQQSIPRDDFTEDSISQPLTDIYQEGVTKSFKKIGEFNRKIKKYFNNKFFSKDDAGSLIKELKDTIDDFMPKIFDKDFVNEKELLANSDNELVKAFLKQEKENSKKTNNIIKSKNQELHAELKKIKKQLKNGDITANQAKFKLQKFKDNLVKEYIKIINKETEALDGKYTNKAKELSPSKLLFGKKSTSKSAIHDNIKAIDNEIEANNNIINDIRDKESQKDFSESNKLQDLRSANNLLYHYNNQYKFKVLSKVEKNINQLKKSINSLELTKLKNIEDIKNKHKVGNTINDAEEKLLIEKEISEKNKFINKIIEQKQNELEKLETNYSSIDPIKRVHSLQVKLDRLNKQLLKEPKNQKLLDEISSIESEIQKLKNIKESENAFTITKDKRNTDSNNIKTMRSSTETKVDTVDLKIIKLSGSEMKEEFGDGVKGFFETVPNDDGSYNIYINSESSNIGFKSAIHELRHSFLKANNTDENFFSNIVNKIHELYTKDIKIEDVKIVLKEKSTNISKIEKKIKDIYNEPDDAVNEEIVNNLIDTAQMNTLVRKNSKEVLNKLGLTDEEIALYSEHGKLNDDGTLGAGSQWLSDEELNELNRVLLGDSKINNIISLEDRLINSPDSPLHEAMGNVAKAFEEPTAKKIIELQNKIIPNIKFNELISKMYKQSENSTLSSVFFANSELASMQRLFGKFEGWNKERVRLLAKTKENLYNEIVNDLGTTGEFTLSKFQSLGLHKLFDKFENFQSILDAIKDKKAYDTNDLISYVGSLIDSYTADLEPALRDSIKNSMIDNLVSTEVYSYGGKNVTQPFIMKLIRNISNEDGNILMASRKGSKNPNKANFTKIFATGADTSVDVYHKIVDLMEKTYTEVTGNVKPADIYRNNKNPLIQQMDTMIAINRISNLSKKGKYDFTRLRQVFDNKEKFKKYVNIINNSEDRLIENNIYHKQFGTNFKHNLTKDELTIKTGKSLPKGALLITKKAGRFVYAIKKNYTAIGHQDGKLSGSLNSADSYGKNTYKIKFKIKTKYKTQQNGKTIYKDLKEPQLVLDGKNYKLSDLKNVKTIKRDGTVEFFIPEDVKMANKNNLFDTSFSTSLMRNEYVLQNKVTGSGMTNTLMKQLIDNNVVLSAFEYNKLKDEDISKYSPFKLDKHGKTYYVPNRILHQFVGTKGVKINGKLQSNITRAVVGAIDLAKGTLITHNLSAYLNSAIASTGTYMLHSPKPNPILFKSIEAETRNILVKMNKLGELNLKKLKGNVEATQQYNKLKKEIYEDSDIGFAIMNGLQSTIRQDLSLLQNMPRNKLISMFRHNGSFNLSDQATKGMEEIFLRPETKFGDIAGSVFDKTEVVPKMALYLDLLKSGKDREYAISYTKMAFPDYTLNLNNTLGIIGEFIPFLKFFSSVPKMIEFGLSKKPKTLIGAKVAMSLAIYASYSGANSQTDNWFEDNNFLKVPTFDSTYLYTQSWSNFNLEAPAGLSPSVIMNQFFNPFDLRIATTAGS